MSSATEQTELLMDDRDSTCDITLSNGERVTLKSDGGHHLIIM